jgi:plasmid stabilization system protein ParE
MRIRSTRAAAADLEEIHDFLVENYPHLVHSTITKLYDSVRSLKDSPHRGRPGREEGTRELLFASLPYIAAYRVKEQTSEVHPSHVAATFLIFVPEISSRTSFTFSAFVP